MDDPLSLAVSELDSVSAAAGVSSWAASSSSPQAAVTTARVATAAPTMNRRTAISISLLS
jgi:hypothetical protein